MSLQNATWIRAPYAQGSETAVFRREIATKDKLVSATAEVSAIGIYAMWIDGKRVGKGVLTPGFTSYDHRVQYQTYDVTELLGEVSTVELGLACGWASGQMGAKQTKVYADHSSVIAALTLRYADGTEERVTTGTDWSVRTSKIRYSEIYHGERVDETYVPEPRGMAVADTLSVELVPQQGEWIMERERIAPVRLIRTPKGETVIDFGQNLTGYAEIRIRGERGGRIVVDHAEVLDADGNFYTENMRSAENRCEYVLGGGEETFKPIYSFQGFRYIRLTEYPSETVELDGITAIAVYSELRRTGHFSCGDAKVNQLYHNLLWGQKGNYLDIPTDCPQRDERLGWTGDAQVFCRTAALNYDVRRFFVKWLADMRLDQKADGWITKTVPNVFRHMQTAAGWGDACCIIPWELYQAYGEVSFLADNFDMMQKWVEYLRHAGPVEELWLGGDEHPGDWLAMDGDPDEYAGATPVDLIASAFYAYSTSILVQAGELLGRDMQDYRDLLARVRAAFRARSLPGGKLDPVAGEHDAPYVKETQTAYVLILQFGLYEGEEERRTFAARLAEMIRSNGDRMTTGFLGTPYILHVLSENGYHDLACRLLLQEQNPSWLYSVCHGATTMWEHWNSIKEDGSFWSTDMNSFNHYAYGAVGDWLYGVLGGIRVDPDGGAGYRKLILRPMPCRALQFVNCSVDTACGKVESNWYFGDGACHFECSVPEGCEATLCLPDGSVRHLTGGDYLFALPN